MIAKLIIPIETLKGQLRKDGYYFRMYKGKQIVQRCPNRKGHVKTEAEAENQRRFIGKYRRKKAEDKTPPNFPAMGVTPEFDAGTRDKETRV